MGAGKGARRKAEIERFNRMPEADLLELRNVLSREVQVLMEDKNRKIGQIQRINKILTERKSTEIDRVVVTDHAIVRYLERVEGLDLEAIRLKITEMTRRAIRRDQEFMDDPVTGFIVVRKDGSDSVATIMHNGAVSPVT